MAWPLQVGDRKRQGMALHASALSYLGEQNTPAAIDCGLQALAIYRDIGVPRFVGLSFWAADRLSWISVGVTGTCPWQQVTITLWLFFCRSCGALTDTSL